MGVYISDKCSEVCRKYKRNSLCYKSRVKWNGKWRAEGGCKIILQKLEGEFWKFHKVITVDGFGKHNSNGTCSKFKII